ncbi:MAG: hypothetical protein KatS3mg110_0650 [Pirellulaceae bacterium]|nr:MAG: hypothetical protein KatS3mg110_0650 [Pirellulaceae bacterium]
MRALMGLLAVGLLFPAAGCCTTCPAHTVPVSLEGMYNFLRYYDVHCAWHYPYSCPPCPYPDAATAAMLGYGYVPPPEPIAPGTPEERSDGDQPQPEESAPDESTPSTGLYSPVSARRQAGDSGADY